MAAITSTVIAGAGLAIGAAQAIKANKAKKDADSAAFRAEAAMRGVKEENVMKQVQVPTLGYDLAQESQAQRDISTISALQGAGAAGVIGGIGKVAQATERHGCSSGRSRYRAETCSERVWNRGQCTCRCTGCISCSTGSTKPSY